MCGKDTHEFQCNGHLQKRREGNEMGWVLYLYYILFIMKKEFKQMCKVH